jgi:hypothetical protein
VKREERDKGIIGREREEREWEERKREENRYSGDGFTCTRMRE